MTKPMLHKSATRAEVNKRIRIALEILDEREKLLLSSNVNERALTHKLGVYLELLSRSMTLTVNITEKGRTRKSSTS
jgi:hypothetical protein